MTKLQSMAYIKADTAVKNNRQHADNENTFVPEILQLLDGLLFYCTIFNFQCLIQMVILAPVTFVCLFSLQSCNKHYDTGQLCEKIAGRSIQKWSDIVRDQMGLESIVLIRVQIEPRLWIVSVVCSAA